MKWWRLSAITQAIGVVNGGRQCGRINSIYVEEQWVQVLTHIHKVRERGKERHKYTWILLFKETATTTTRTTFTKVTLYSDWLRATALYNIYRNSLNLDCPRDSVNTTIIHPSSTLRRNGRIQGLNRNYRYIQGYRASWFCLSRQDPKTKGRTGRGRKGWSRSSKNRCRLSETILGVWL